jgi:hypothetical protein
VRRRATQQLGGQRGADVARRAGDEHRAAHPLVRVRTRAINCSTTNKLSEGV